MDTRLFGIKSMDNKTVKVKREKVSSLITVIILIISLIILILGIFIDVKNSNFIYFFGLTFLGTVGNICRIDYKFLQNIKPKIP